MSGPEDIVLTVDGEQFRVRRAPSVNAVYHYDWLTGRNAGYGFSTGSNSTTTPSEEQHMAAIRDFLAAIDPETGYIAD